MGFWKVLGGAALGVVAVVAAPIAGPVGAVTALGAAVAGTAGAAAGGIASLCDDSEDKARREGYRDGREDGLAEGAEKILALQRKIEVATNKYKTVKKQEEFIIGLLAVGFSISNIDGDMDEQELEDINAFVGGVSLTECSPDFLNQISKLQKNPPSFEGAMKYVQNYIPKASWDLIDDLLLITAESDAYVCESEKEFMAKWKSYKEANRSMSNLVKNNEQNKSLGNLSVLQQINLSVEDFNEGLEVGGHEEKMYFIMGVIALGFSLAKVDGSVNDEENDAIFNFVFGESQLNIDPILSDGLADFRKSPPTPKMILKELDAKGQRATFDSYGDLVDAFLVTIAKADGDICAKEKAFLSNYHFGTTTQE